MAMMILLVNAIKQVDFLRVYGGSPVHLFFKNGKISYFHRNTSHFYNLSIPYM